MVKQVQEIKIDKYKLCRGVIGGGGGGSKTINYIAQKALPELKKKK